jgi:hypothetical protein
MSYESLAKALDHCCEKNDGKPVDIRVAKDYLMNAQYGYYDDDGEYQEYFPTEQDIDTYLNNMTV